MLVSRTNCTLTDERVPTYITDAMERFCHLPGMGCSKVKRAAEAIADALAVPEPEADAEAEPFRRYCHLPGQGCSKAKRAAEEFKRAAEDAVAAL